MPRLDVTDLTLRPGDEPRVRDLVLAERLGFAHPHDIRQLISRNRAELASYGEVCGTVPQTSPQGGRPGREYHLNEAQALLLCTLSRTSTAAMVRRELITVFMAHRRTIEIPVDTPIVVHEKADLLGHLKTVEEVAALIRRMIDGAGPLALAPPAAPQSGVSRHGGAKCAAPPALPPPAPRAPARPAANRDPQDILYGMPAVAAHLGLGVRQAEHLKDKHGLPTFKIGRIVCAAREDLSAWVQAQREGGR